LPGLSEPDAIIPSPAAGHWLLVLAKRNDIEIRQRFPVGLRLADGQLQTTKDWRPGIETRG